VILGIGNDLDDSITELQKYVDGPSLFFFVSNGAPQAAREDLIDALD